MPTQHQSDATEHADAPAFAAGALALGLLADLGSTAAGLHVGLVETNPVGAAMLAAAGLPSLLAVKLGVSALLVAEVVVCRRRWGALAGEIALAGSLLTAGIWMLAAGWNTVLIGARIGWSL